MAVIPGLVSYSRFFMLRITCVGHWAMSLKSLIVEPQQRLVDFLGTLFPSKPWGYIRDNRDQRCKYSSSSPQRQLNKQHILTKTLTLNVWGTCAILHQIEQIFVLGKTKQLCLINSMLYQKTYNRIHASISRLEQNGLCKCILQQNSLK